MRWLSAWEYVSHSIVTSTGVQFCIGWLFFGHIAHHLVSSGNMKADYMQIRTHLIMLSIRTGSGTAPGKHSSSATMCPCTSNGTGSVSSQHAHGLGLSVEFSERIELPEPDDPAGRLYAGMLIRKRETMPRWMAHPKHIRTTEVEKGFTEKRFLDSYFARTSLWTEFIWKTDLPVKSLYWNGNLIM